MDWLTTIVRGLAKPLKWWVVIAVWERGLRVRLGKNPTELHPGIHFRIPWLDRIYVQSVRLRTATSTNINATTRLRKNIVISIAIHYAIDDVLKLYDTLSTPEQTIRAAAEKAIVQFIGGEDNPRQIDIAVEGAEAICDHDWGLKDVTVDVTGFTYCRVYRILHQDWQNGGGLGGLLNDDGGERK